MLGGCLTSNRERWSASNRQLLIILKMLPTLISQPVKDTVNFQSVTMVLDPTTPSPIFSCTNHNMCHSRPKKIET